MHYVNHIGISLLLLAAPSVLLAVGENPLAPAKSYWETVKAFPGDEPMLAIGLGVAVTAGAVYAAHTYSKSFREKVSGPALEEVKDYWKNLKDGDTNTLLDTSVAVIAVSAGFIHVHKERDLLGKLKITTPRVSVVRSIAGYRSLQQAQSHHQPLQQIEQQYQQLQRLQQLE